MWPIIIQRAIKEADAKVADGAHKASAVPGAARSDSAAILGLSKKLTLGDCCGVSAGSSLFGAIAQLLAGQASLRAYFCESGRVLPLVCIMLPSLVSLWLLELEYTLLSPSLDTFPTH